MIRDKRKQKRIGCSAFHPGGVSLVDCRFGDETAILQVLSDLGLAQGTKRQKECLTLRFIDVVQEIARRRQNGKSVVSFEEVENQIPLGLSEELAMHLIEPVKKQYDFAVLLARPRPPQCVIDVVRAKVRDEFMWLL
jgi:hypothetical protein